MIALPEQGAPQQQVLRLQGNQCLLQNAKLQATAVAGDHREIHVAGAAGIQQAFGALKNVHGNAAASRSD